jgi:HK97 family phage portal protein
MLLRGDDNVKTSPLYEFFKRPNQLMSRYDLWKETAARWHLEGEAFWWVGPEYSGGIPEELYILDPRKLRHKGEGGYPTGSFGVLSGNFSTRTHRWFYQTDGELIPILSDEPIHFRDWNPWNAVRGVNPLAALEQEQDYYANKANSTLLKNNAVPMGILKTEQSIRPEEADAIERRWESKYRAVKAGRKIAVLGKGTEFKPLAFSPDAVKLFELKRWNLYTILAKYFLMAAKVAFFTPAGGEYQRQNGQPFREGHGGVARRLLEVHAYSGTETI